MWTFLHGPGRHAETMDFLAIEIEDRTIIENRGKLQRRPGQAAVEREVSAKIVGRAAPRDWRAFRGRQRGVLEVKERRSRQPGGVVVGGGSPSRIIEGVVGAVAPRVSDGENALRRVGQCGRRGRPIRHPVIVLADIHQLERWPKTVRRRIPWRVIVVGHLIDGDH